MWDKSRIVNCLKLMYWQSSKGSKDVLLLKFEKGFKEEWERFGELKRGTNVSYGSYLWTL